MNRLSYKDGEILLAGIATGVKIDPVHLVDTLINESNKDNLIQAIELVINNLNSQIKISLNSEEIDYIVGIFTSNLDNENITQIKEQLYQKYNNKLRISIISKFDSLNFYNKEIISISDVDTGIHFSDDWFSPDSTVSNIDSLQKLLLTDFFTKIDQWCVKNSIPSLNKSEIDFILNYIESTSKITIVNEIKEKLYINASNIDLNYDKCLEEKFIELCKEFPLKPYKNIVTETVDDIFRKYYTVSSLDTIAELTKDLDKEANNYEELYQNVITDHYAIILEKENAIKSKLFNRLKFKDITLSFEDIFNIKIDEKLVFQMPLLTTSVILPNDSVSVIPIKDLIKIYKGRYTEALVEYNLTELELFRIEKQIENFLFHNTKRTELVKEQPNLDLFSPTYIELIGNLYVGDDDFDEYINELKNLNIDFYNLSSILKIDNFEKFQNLVTFIKETHQHINLKICNKLFKKYVDQIFINEKEFYDIIEEYDNWYKLTKIENYLKQLANKIIKELKIVRIPYSKSDFVFFNYEYQYNNQKVLPVIFYQVIINPVTFQPLMEFDASYCDLFTKMVEDKSKDKYTENKPFLDALESFTKELQKCVGYFMNTCDLKIADNAYNKIYNILRNEFNINLFQRVKTKSALYESAFSQLLSREPIDNKIKRIKLIKDNNVICWYLDDRIIAQDNETINALEHVKSKNSEMFRTFIDKNIVNLLTKIFNYTPTKNEIDFIDNLYSRLLDGK